jgi:glucosamine--fructose-6-phosphate aminotransferase (isomerizing)
MQADILQKEIDQQPEIIRKLISTEKSNIFKIVSELKNRYKYIIIAARGSSDNAARYAQYLFGAHNRTQVALATPSLFTLYKEIPNMQNALVIGISQSGQSPDIVSVLAAAKKQSCPTLCITNNIRSPLANTSDFCIPLHADKETATAATKSYTASLVALALFSASLENDHKRLDEINKLPEYIDKTLSETIYQLPTVQRYRYMEHCVVIGRGYNYSTAFEISLKIKELSRVVAVPYSSADFRHGPIATVHSGFPIILIAVSGKTFNDIWVFSKRLKNLGAEMIVISNQEKLLKESQIPFSIPKNISEWLSPVVSVIPGQLFARQLTLDKGLNTDYPDGLTKVTETY